MSGKTKALLIGLNYTNSPRETELTGCVRDVHNMVDYIKKQGLKNVEVLTDDDVRVLPRLTWAGIMVELHKLSVQSWSDDLDLVFFHYSGHGRQVKDTSGEEKDGLDEGIVPIDYGVHGTITDDVLNALFTSFNPRTKVVCVFDCCHSSTILDLPYNWSNGRLNDDSDDKVKSDDKVDDNTPFILCFSSCQDYQIAGEFHKEVDTGAFTTCFLDQLAAHPRSSVHEIQRLVREELKSNGYKQVPAMSSSRPLPLDLCFSEQLRGW